MERRSWSCSEFQCCDSACSYPGRFDVVPGSVDRGLFSSLLRLFLPVLWWLLAAVRRVTVRPLVGEQVVRGRTNSSSSFLNCASFVVVDIRKKKFDKID